MIMDIVIIIPLMLEQGGSVFYNKCVDHRLVQDLGSSPGILFGRALVRTLGLSHKKLWETQWESEFEFMKNK